MKGFPLFLDEDSCDNDWVAALRNRHVDVTTVLEIGLQERSDEDQLVWATNAGRAIYTSTRNISATCIAFSSNQDDNTPELSSATSSATPSANNSGDLSASSMQNPRRDAQSSRVPEQLELIAHNSSFAVTLGDAAFRIQSQRQRHGTKIAR